MDLEIRISAKLSNGRSYAMRRDMQLDPFGNSVAEAIRSVEKDVRKVIFFLHNPQAVIVDETPYD